MFPKKKKTPGDFHVLMNNLTVEAANEMRATMLCSILVPVMREQFRNHVSHSEIRRGMNVIANECVTSRFVDARFIARINDVVSLEIEESKKTKNLIIKDFLKRLDSKTIKATESLGLEITTKLEEISDMEKELSTWEEENIEGDNGTSQFVENCFTDCCMALKKFLPDQYKITLGIGI